MVHRPVIIGSTEKFLFWFISETGVGLTTGDGTRKTFNGEKLHNKLHCKIKLHIEPDYTAPVWLYSGHTNEIHTESSKKFRKFPQLQNVEQGWKRTDLRTKKLPLERRTCSYIPAVEHSNLGNLNEPFIKIEIFDRMWITQFSFFDWIN